MENSGVLCNVHECVHNIECKKCNLGTIEVTNMKTSPDSMAVPHFCKSYEEK